MVTKRCWVNTKMRKMYFMHKLSNVFCTYHWQIMAEVMFWLITNYCESKVFPETSSALKLLWNSCTVYKLDRRTFPGNACDDILTYLDAFFHTWRRNFHRKTLQNIRNLKTKQPRLLHAANITNQCKNATLKRQQFIYRNIAHVDSCAISRFRLM